jgi:hypothetical protein
MTNVITNVVVGRQRNIQVSTNATAGIIDSVAGVTLKNTPTLITGTGVERLVNLRDVNANDKTNGVTIVYDSLLNLYVAKKLDLDYITGIMDGGTF